MNYRCFVEMVKDEKKMQQKEEETRVGGREGWPIKIIETAGRTFEQTLVNTDPFGGNLCNDPKCLPSKDPKNKINCRRNTVCYRVTCLLYLKAGLPPVHECYDNAATCYFGQSGKNAHCQIKEHVSKFISKSAKVCEESALFKHLENTNGGVGSTLGPVWSRNMQQPYIQVFIPF